MINTRFLASLAILSTAFPALADVALPSIFSDHMVLQRDTPQHVWGTAEAGEKITVTFDRHSEKTTADAKGNWLVDLPTLSADGGKAHKRTVEGNNKIVLEKLLIGDVWIGSGQSNMEWPLDKTDNSKEFIEDAEHSRIRLFHIPKVQVNELAKDVKATWKECTP